MSENPTISLNISDVKKFSTKTLAPPTATPTRTSVSSEDAQLHYDMNVNVRSRLQRTLRQTRRKRLQSSRCLVDTCAKPLYRHHGRQTRAVQTSRPLRDRCKKTHLNLPKILFKLLSTVLCGAIFQAIEGTHKCEQRADL